MTGNNVARVNLYLKRRPLGPHNGGNGNNMGIQSQQQVSNTKRQYQLVATNSFTKRRKGDQLTLQGDIAFLSKRDCKICVAQSIRKFINPNHPVPKRSHHHLCTKNSKTRGMGPVSVHTQETEKEAKALEALFNKPLEDHEKGSMAHVTKEAHASFFRPREPAVRQQQQQQQDSQDSKPAASIMLSATLCKAVSEMTSDASFRDKHKNKGAPLAIVALACEVSKKIIRSEDEFGQHFKGLTFTVPPCNDSNNNPHYHSIVGNDLLLVDWPKKHGITVACQVCWQFGEPENKFFQESNTISYSQIGCCYFLVHGDDNEVQHLP